MHDRITVIVSYNADDKYLVTRRVIFKYRSPHTPLIPIILSFTIDKTLLPKPVGKVDSSILKMEVFIHEMIATWLKPITYNMCYCKLKLPSSAIAIALSKLLYLMLTGSRSGIISSFSHKMYLASAFQITWK